MSRSKVERLVNLTIALMATRQPLTVERIGQLVTGYDPEDGEAFRRMFERDKEELRDLGVPVELTDAGYGEVGYRVPPQDYALPELTLDAEEASALGLAARLWTSAALAAAGQSALQKLAAAGVEAVPPPDLSVQVGATESAFPTLLSAAVERREVSFDYRRPGSEAATRRRVQPWGVVSWHGHWYLAGHDLDRDATRVFRLSRIEGEVGLVGTAAAFAPPPRVDLPAMVAETQPVGVIGTAELAVRPATCHALRREAGVGAEQGRVRLGYADLDRTADWLTGYGPDVVVLSPPELRAAVVARLRAVLG